MKQILYFLFVFSIKLGLAHGLQVTKFEFVQLNDNHCEFKAWLPMHAILHEFDDIDAEYKHNQEELKLFKERIIDYLKKNTSIRINSKNYALGSGNLLLAEHTFVGLRMENTPDSIETCQIKINCFEKQAKQRNILLYHSLAEKKTLVLNTDNDYTFEIKKGRNYFMYCIFSSFALVLVVLLIWLKRIKS